MEKIDFENMTVGDAIKLNERERRQKMNCEYCYLKNKYHDGKHWEQKYGDCGCICNHGDGVTTDIAVWNEHEPAESLILIRNVKYCPFCGNRIMVADRLSEIAPHKEDA